MSYDLKGRKATNAHLEKIARPLFPRYGLHDVGSMIATAVKYRHNDGYVSLDRIEGRWSWFAAKSERAIFSNRYIIPFPADYRRDAAEARRHLEDQLDRLRWDADIPEDA